MLHIANSAVQVEKSDNMAFHQGQQCLKYQFMMTQRERECNKSCRTGDKNVCQYRRPGGEPAFLDKGFKFIKGGSIC